MKINKRNLLVVILSIISSIVSGVLTKDLIVGGNQSIMFILSEYRQES